jgi:hypothetical protein
LRPLRLNIFYRKERKGLRKERKDCLAKVGE